ncbi:uncharacterized protein H6S33_007793 [Morchella sextelata]|uniref:uncharacterized protein n=1 Tax=Morchella sextelata TaxID=1174677 RepID=UPI001D03B731|nr:uncharacterized protein H6S33_007793 [Morchella sextelata]KAH0603471.1 hypothetical protein H6S33_007793 [Morchella sextelata]
MDFLPYDPVHGAMQQHHNSAPPPPPPPPQPMDLASSPIQEKAKPGRPRRSRTNNVNVNNINNGPPPPATAESSTISTTTTSTGFSTADGRVVEIKTKFPVARIKRIMQADEDVGKVAQVTPVVVSKALELFMIALCEKASAQARQRNSKRITAGHLKQAVLHEEQFDFLAEIIAKVPDIPLPTVDSSNNNGGNCSSGGGGPESEDAQAPPSVKKPRKPRTRKVKNEDC